MSCLGYYKQKGKKKKSAKGAREWADNWGMLCTEDIALARASSLIGLFSSWRRFFLVTSQAKGSLLNCRRTFGRCFRKNATPSFPPLPLLRCWRFHAVAWSAMSLIERLRAHFAISCYGGSKSGPSASARASLIGCSLRAAICLLVSQAATLPRAGIRCLLKCVSIAANPWGIGLSFFRLRLSTHSS